MFERFLPLQFFSGNGWVMEWERGHHLPSRTSFAQCKISDKKRTNSVGKGFLGIAHNFDQFWICNGRVFHACMQVGISESFLAAVFVGFDGYDNSVFNSVGSESPFPSTVSRIWIPHFLCLQRFDFDCFCLRLFSHGAHKKRKTCRTLAIIDVMWLAAPCRLNVPEEI